jgi:acyl-CoA synthetase (AMP-forming)/AMP-acid ligase II
MLEIEGIPSPKGYKTVNQLIAEGSKLPKLEPLKWSAGDGAKKTAFLCYSSGTSGLPVSTDPRTIFSNCMLIQYPIQKGVMISHKNVIANTLQIAAYEESGRKQFITPGNNAHTENVLGLLPMSHIYGLVVICHASLFRGDGIVVLPKFDFKQCMQAIQDHNIVTLYLVPPIIVMMTKSPEVLKQFDLSSVKGIFTGAAPLGEETAADLGKLFPSWNIRQGYGLTETCTVVSATANHDIWFGSSGSLLPLIETKLVTPEGNEVTGYDQPGELCVKSPAVVLGYLNNDKANKETFILDGNGDRWMHTGDEAVFRKNPKSGNEHVFIVDRIKELIKVKVRNLPQHH